MSDLLQNEVNWASHRLLFSTGIVTDLLERNLTMWPYVLFDGIKEVQVVPKTDEAPKCLEYNLIMDKIPKDFKEKADMLLKMIDMALGDKEYNLEIKVNGKIQFSTVQNVEPRKQSANRVRATKRSRKKTK